MTHTIPASEYIEIRRDGQYVATVHNGGLLHWFHAQHSFSLDHALTHEGYTLHAVEERYAVYYSTHKTEKPIFHRAFDTMRGANRSANIMFTKLVNKRGYGTIEWMNENRIQTTAQLERLINGKWVEQ